MGWLSCCAVKWTEHFADMCLSVVDYSMLILISLFFCSRHKTPLFTCCCPWLYSFFLLPEKWPSFSFLWLCEQQQAVSITFAACLSVQCPAVVSPWSVICYAAWQNIHVLSKVNDKQLKPNNLLVFVSNDANDSFAAEAYISTAWHRSVLVVTDLENDGVSCELCCSMHWRD